MRLPSISIAPRRVAALVHDLGMTALAIPICYFLRFGLLGTAIRTDDILLLGAVILPVAVVVYWAAGLYSGIWRFASIPDLVNIVRAVTILTLLMMVLDFGTRGVISVPRGVVAGFWFVLCALLGGPRLLYRIYRDGRLAVHNANSARPAVPVLIAGTDSQAEVIIRSLETGDGAFLRPVALVASKRGHIGQRIRNVPVLGEMKDIDRIVAELDKRGERPRRLIVTDALLDRNGDFEEFVARAQRLDLRPERMSRPASISGIGQSGLHLAPVRIEDLLGRSTRKLDRQLMRELVAGQRVLVTGAGGTIGSELCRQIAGMDCASVTLVENSEFALYKVRKELTRLAGHTRIVDRLCDVRDARRVTELFTSFSPDLVFHAAALKHVPIVEEHPAEGVLTNTVGTMNVAEAALAAGAKAMILISTDKAVRPVSAMGASKRAAESYLQALEGKGGPTRFVSVRFGNVLGSSGSVVPLFQEQLEMGGPLTVTHPDMHRYFMTVSEAVGLVLMASALGLSGGEKSPIYVLDMGKPVRILDLAQRMIRLAGLEPGQDVEISFTGLREGEKLKEDLFEGSQPLRPTRLPGILATAPGDGRSSVGEAQFRQLAEAARRNDRLGVIAGLCNIIPEYAAARSAQSFPTPVPIDSTNQPRIASSIA